MATAKIGRHSKRSPAATRYRNEGRNKTNKIKKLQRHLKKFPEDTRNAANLSSLKAGKTGDKPAFKPVPKPEDRKRDSRMEQPCVEDWSKMDGLFFVAALPERVTLCVTPHWSEALKQYVKTKTKSVIQQRTTGKFKTLRSQSAKA